MALRIGGYVSTLIEQGIADGRFRADHLRELSSRVGEEVSQTVLDAVNKAYEDGRSVAPDRYNEGYKTGYAEGQADQHQHESDATWSDVTTERVEQFLDEQKSDQAEAPLDPYFAAQTEVTKINTLLELLKLDGNGWSLSKEEITAIIERILEFSGVDLDSSARGVAKKVFDLQKRALNDPHLAGILTGLGL